MLFLLFFKSGSGFEDEFNNNSAYVYITFFGSINAVDNAICSCAPNIIVAVIIFVFVISRHRYHLKSQEDSSRVLDNNIIGIVRHSFFEKLNSVVNLKENDK